MKQGYLVVTRLAGEVIDIGPDIEVKVFGFDRGRVKLGVKAPPTVRVTRREITERDEDDAEGGVMKGLQL